jgi:hypothetical protein
MKLWTWNEMKWTKIWCKIILETDVEQTKGNGGSYLYLHPFGNLVQRNLHGGFHMPTIQGSFLKTLSMNELWMNYE